MHSRVQKPVLFSKVFRRNLKNNAIKITFENWEKKIGGKSRPRRSKPLYSFEKFVVLKRLMF